MPRAFGQLNDRLRQAAAQPQTDQNAHENHDQPHGHDHAETVQQALHIGLQLRWIDRRGVSTGGNWIAPGGFVTFVHVGDENPGDGRSHGHNNEEDERADGEG